MISFCVHMSACGRLILAIGLQVAAISLAAPAQTSSDSPLYLDPKLPVSRRVEDLLQRMTLEVNVGHPRNAGTCDIRATAMQTTPEDLAMLDRDMHWTVVPGTFDMMVGKSSADISLTLPLQVLEADPPFGYGFTP
jgi:hypothetical protein